MGPDVGIVRRPHPRTQLGTMACTRQGGKAGRRPTSCGSPSLLHPAKKIQHSDVVNMQASRNECSMCVCSIHPECKLGGLVECGPSLAFLPNTCSAELFDDTCEKPDRSAMVAETLLKDANHTIIGFARIPKRSPRFL